MSRLQLPYGEVEKNKKTTTRVSILSFYLTYMMLKNQIFKLLLLT